MTIAISLKVNDGVVLAADSASTLLEKTTQGPGVVQVFNNANKVFNLRKGLPLGLITWGAGSIGKAAISTLAKDLRERLTRRDEAHPEFHVDAENYTVEEVAGNVRKFFFDELYLPAFRDWPEKPPVGFIVAGYSAGGDLAEEFKIEVNAKGECESPIRLRTKEECGVNWFGEPEAITRLVLGFSPQLPIVLEQRLGIKADEIPKVMSIIRDSLNAPVVYDSMPIQDAIDLAEFFVDVTERFSRFTPGAITVGGPIEIAAITKHEGFKWIKRKYYFSRALNPEPEHPKQKAEGEGIS